MGLGQLLAGQLLAGQLRADGCSPDTCSLGHLLDRTVARRIFARKITSMWMYEKISTVIFKKSNGK
jgi:hypothetical protein